MDNVKILPHSVIKINSAASINFAAIFVALSVALPWFIHQFNLAGQVYLPMHFFVLIAALLLGWRTGLIVGLFTPLISYAVSGMPLLAVLPQITLEVAMYGLIAGLVREKLHLNLYWSLLIAVVAGRVGSVIGIVIFSQASLNPLSNVLQATKIGGLGLLIQLALVPLFVYAIRRYFDRHEAHPIG